MILFSIAGALGGARAAALRHHRRNGVRRCMDDHRRRRSRCRATGRAVDAAARNNVWLAYPMNPGARAVLGPARLARRSGIAGAIVQLGITAKGNRGDKNGYVFAQRYGELGRLDHGGQGDGEGRQRRLHAAGDVSARIGEAEG